MSFPMASQQHNHYPLSSTTSTTNNNNNTNNNFVEAFPNDSSHLHTLQMRFFFQKSLSSPPSSSSSSSSLASSSSLVNKIKSRNQKSGVSCGNSEDKRGHSSSFTQRRLTRQRKLRHLTDQEVGINMSKPGSDHHWSCSAVPQPLPLPELPLTRRNLGQPNAQPCCSAFTTKQVSASSTSPPRSRASNCRGAPSQEADIGFNNFEALRLHIPSRSAPSSGFSSLNVSPCRPSRDANNVVSCTSKSVWMNSPSSAPTSGLTSPIFYSPDRSPLNSPILHPSCRKTKNINMLQQCFSLQANFAHPLPLPPATAPSQSSYMPSPSQAVVHHTVSIPDRRSTQWQKGRLIGRGTYGSVYHGTHRVTGASCAIKEVDVIPDDPKSAECIKQLEQEIRVLSELEHQNIVQYYGSEIVEDHFYIYMEYVHPGSLSKYIQEHCGNMTESIVRHFTRHILSGLAYLHSRLTIHRDIKGANLLVDQSGTVKLADFGMAKHLTGLSSQLSLKGSPHWMAPEVMKAVMCNDSNPDLACAIDIWSLGCTVIEMFTGKPPWGDLEGPRAMFQVLNKSPPIPEKLCPEGKDFLYRCFRRDPAERPSAVVLLEHPFVKNCDEPTASLRPSGTKLMDKSESSRGCEFHKTDSMTSSIVSQSIPSSLRRKSEASKQSSIKTSSCSPAPHRSQCSMVVHPCSPTMQQVHGLLNLDSPPNKHSTMPLDNMNNHPLSL